MASTPSKSRSPLVVHASAPGADVHLFRPHPWHGLDAGPEPPDVLNGFIEITPFDMMKYEVDKVSGYLRVDRPQRSSAQHPTLYGFIPRTYCGERVAALAQGATKGDHDPLDICVLSERAITRNEIVVRCRVIGGLQMLDRGEADDKIISVLENDYVWGHARDIGHVPAVLVERLQHYFLTYKLVPGEAVHAHIGMVYGRDHARRVVRAAMADYEAAFAPPPAEPPPPAPTSRRIPAGARPRARAKRR